MGRAWVVVWASAFAGVVSCGNKQVTQERATVSDTDQVTTTAADDPDNPTNPSGNDDDEDESSGGTTGGPGPSTSSPTDPSATDSASDTDTDTDFTTGASTFGTDFTSGFTTGGDQFWCADHDLGEAAVPVSYSGSNLGQSDANLGSCTEGVNGDEYLVTWTAPDAGTYFIDTIGSDIDTVLYVLDQCSGTELACADDISTDVLQSSLSLDLSAGETILIVVDGFNGDASGSFELYIST